MNAGILAAGTGSRFVEAGWSVPKPLIEVGGKPLISRVLESFFDAGICRVHVFLNGSEGFDPVETYLRNRPEARRIQVTRRTTRSSFETFHLLCRSMGKPPYVVSTVDSLFPQEGIRDFLDLASYPAGCDLALAVTDFVHDEHPLWVSLSEEGRVLGLGDSVFPRQYVTAGLYLILGDLKGKGDPHGFSALREFLQYLTKNKTIIWGKRIGDSLDIDNPEDVQVAEAVLSAIRERSSCSPNSGWGVQAFLHREKPEV